MKILLCTIVRNRQDFASTWASSLVLLASQSKDHEYSVSLYENDSADESSDTYLAECKKSLRNSGQFDKIYFCSENIGTIAVEAEAVRVDSQTELRLENLSNARNKCIENAFAHRHASYYDKIIFIEPDISYCPAQAHELIRKSVGTHIISGRSALYPTSDIFYDTWATRFAKKIIPLTAENAANWSKHHNDTIKLIKKSEGTLVKLASTFSGFCVYDSEIFANKVSFTFQKDGIHDCDTSLICFDAIEKGYDKIFMYKDMLIFHYR